MLKIFGISVFLIALMAVAFIPNLFETPTYYADKMLHILVCVVVLIWAFFSFRSRVGIIITCVVLCVGGLGVELLQGLIPGRSVSADDVGANLIGVALGVVIGGLLKRGYDAGERDLG